MIEKAKMLFSLSPLSDGVKEQGHKTKKEWQYG
jgi:hypothetical protein